MLRLKALWYLLCFPKCLSINAKNFFPIFVCTFLLNGGLYHSIFRLRFLVGCLVSAGCSNVSLKLCPLLFKSTEALRKSSTRLKVFMRML